MDRARGDLCEVRRDDAWGSICCVDWVAARPDGREGGGARRGAALDGELPRDGGGDGGRDRVEWCGRGVVDRWGEEHRGLDDVGVRWPASLQAAVGKIAWNQWGGWWGAR